jgi:hypothetical protein
MDYFTREFSKTPAFKVSWPTRKAHPRFFCIETTPAPNSEVYVIDAGHRQIAEIKTDSGWPFFHPDGGMFFAFEIMTPYTLIYVTR